MDATASTPCDFVVFGGTGDLAMRKLLPALYLRDLDGQLSRDTRVISVARTGFTDDDYRAKVDAEVRAFLPPQTSQATQTSQAERWAAFLRRLHHVPLDIAEPADWARLADRCSGAQPGVRVFYLACAPKLFGPVSRHLAANNLVTSTSRVVLEKPIGHDLASARQINEDVGAVFAEHQIFRIDHYLGKETVQNLLVLRFANTLFEPLWNSGWIDHVQITAAETIGVGSRGGYYDTAGALRDMVQNHLLQLLCLVAMEPPSTVDADAVRDEKLKVLQALAPMSPASLATRTVRGQYRAGAVEGAAVAGYAGETGCDASGTETFVALKVEIANWRWAGVPFYLRTGKRLDRRSSEIVVQFKPVPHSIFPGVLAPGANRLVLRLQPDEGVRLHLTSKEPGPGGYRLRPAALDLQFAEAYRTRFPEAYERLLMDVVRGNPTLFMRRDEIEAAWSWTEPILAGWAATGAAPRPYAAGSSGPAAGIALIERDGRTWHEGDA